MAAFVIVWVVVGSFLLVRIVIEDYRALLSDDLWWEATHTARMLEMRHRVLRMIEARRT